MGFLDKVLGAANKAKDVMGDVQKLGNQVERTINTFSGTSPEPSATLKKASSPAAAAGVIEEDTFIQSATENCRPVTNDFYDGDDAGQEYLITQSFLLKKEFHLFDSGAGEIDASYGYSPELLEDAWCDWNIGDPYVAIGFNQSHYDIVKKYEADGTVSAGNTISRVQHSLAAYKTTRVDGNEIHVCYHFRRGCDTKLYYQFEGCYPSNQRGQELERVVLAALQTMVDTYKEERRPC